MCKRLFDRVECLKVYLPTRVGGLKVHLLSRGEGPVQTDPEITPPPTTIDRDFFGVLPLEIPISFTKNIQFLIHIEHRFLKHRLRHNTLFLFVFVCVLSTLTLQNPIGYNICDITNFLLLHKKVKILMKKHHRDSNLFLVAQKQSFLTQNLFWMSRYT